MRHLLVVLFLSSCDSSNTQPLLSDMRTPSSSDGMVTDGSASPDAGASSRLRYRLFRMLDGSSFILGAGPVGGGVNYLSAPLYDAQLDVICGPFIGAGNNIICAPPTVSVYYMDAGCTSAITVLGALNTPKYVITRSGGLLEAFSVGGPTTAPSIVYAKTPPTCTVQTTVLTSVYALTTVSLNVFASMTLSP